MKKSVEEGADGIKDGGEECVRIGEKCLGCESRVKCNIIAFFDAISEQNPYGGDYVQIR